MTRQELEQARPGPRLHRPAWPSACGLVDELGTLHDAIAEAKKAAGLKADEEVELLILPQPKSFFEQLFGDSSVSSEFDFLAPDLLKTVRQAKLWQRLLSEPTLLWMPYEVKVK